MSTSSIIAAVLAVSCAIIHRNVIKALITRQPLPKAPKWHCWLPKKCRQETDKA